MQKFCENFAQGYKHNVGVDEFYRFMKTIKLMYNVVNGTHEQIHIQKIAGNCGSFCVAHDLLNINLQT